MDDHRMADRASFDLEHTPHCYFVFGISPQSVDRLGGKCDDAAFVQYLGGALNQSW